MLSSVGSASSGELKTIATNDSRMRTPSAMMKPATPCPWRVPTRRTFPWVVPPVVYPRPDSTLGSTDDAAAIVTHPVRSRG
jgi:hypothetical protein